MSAVDLFDSLDALDCACERNGTYTLRVWVDGEKGEASSYGCQSCAEARGIITSRHCKGEPHFAPLRVAS